MGGTRSYANLREMDMKNETSWLLWEDDTKKQYVDIELPPESTNQAYVGSEAVGQAKEVKDIFDKTSRTIYNCDEVDGDMKRGEKVEKLIYIPGKYYEVVYPNNVEKDYNHTVYVFCSYADFEGSKVHVYDPVPDKKFADEPLFLYKYDEKSAISSPANPPLPVVEEKKPRVVEKNKLEFDETASSDPNTYTVDIYKVNDKGSPEEYKIDGEIVNNVTKIPLSQPGA